MNLSGKRSAASTVTLLDKGCEFQGKLSFEGVVRIDGIFRGEIFSQDHLIIGEGALVEATVRVGVLEVGGSLKGATTTDRALIHSTGVVEGRIETKELEVHRGGRIEGNLSMLSPSQAVDLPTLPAESIVHFRQKA